MAFHTSTPIKKSESNISSNLNDTSTEKEDLSINYLCANIENINVNDQSTSYIYSSSESESSEESDTEDQEKKKKWHTLIHNGPLFPPAYERLPENVKLIYDNEEINLSENAEEIATIFAKKLNDDKKLTIDSRFKQNFFEDWRENMNEEERNKIISFDKCDFINICNYFQTKDEFNLSVYKKDNVGKYGSCLIDNKKENISNFMVETPGFYRGHGKHKYFGRIKKRITPEQVTINCSKGKSPLAPTGHEWKEVIENQNVLWLAQWRDNTKKITKEIRIKRNAAKNQENVREKYEITRKLGNILEQIEIDYKNDWKSEKINESQRGVVIYLLNKLALRVGFSNKRRADTTGCCSLLVKHIKLEENNILIIDCYCKNFIRYYRPVKINSSAYKNIQKFIKNKKPEDKVFDKVSPQKINDFLKKYNIDGLSARFFRLYRSSKLLETKLKELTNPSDSEEDKLTSFSIAIQSVAVLCNHQVKNQKKKLVIEKIKTLFAKIDSKCKDSVGNGYLTAQKNELAKQINQVQYCENNNVFNDSTTKLNYVDPRIIVVWCLKHGIPIGRVLPEMEFDWAIREINFVF